MTALCHYGTTADEHYINKSLIIKAEKPEFLGTYATIYGVCAKADKQLASLV